MSCNQLWDTFRDLALNPIPAEKIARSLCAEYLGGSWRTAGENQFSINKISGGMTNQMFKCDLVGVAPAGIEPATVLLRIQCEKDQMQLQNEIAIFIELANAGLGPRLLGILPGGRLEEFVPSRTLTPDESRQLKYTKHVAEVMAHIHQVNVPVSKTPQLIRTMRGWIDRIERNGGKEFELWSKHANVSKERFPSSVRLADLSSEVDKVEKFLTVCDSPVYFTHNDLFAGNILLREGFDVEEDGSVSFVGGEKTVAPNEKALLLIDFEFGIYNYRGFDIGNHMNELGFTCFSEMPTYTVNWDIIEDEQRQREYCRSYVEETYKMLTTPSQLSAAKLTGDVEKDTEMLFVEIQPFKVICNLWWGLWNIICVQEKILGLDFESAFRDRLAMYYSLKKNF